MKFSKSIFTIDSHTMGEPTRVVIAGIPSIPGNSMMEKKIYLEKELDYMRKLLMLEPRGHSGMFGSTLTQPVNPSADLGVVFMDTKGYLNMCGHGIIGTVTVALEMGFISMKKPITEVVLDTPAGLVKTQAKIFHDRVKEVTFQGVPSFVFKADHKVSLPEVGEINVDIAFGGNFFGIVSAKDLGIKVERKNVSRLIYLGTRLREELNKSIKVIHPENKYINSIDLIEIYDSPTDSEANLKNCVIFGKGQVDRSPCGTGTSAKLATLYRKGEIKINEEFVYESILGTKFRGRIDSKTKVGDFPAIIPKITGSAYITGLQQFVVDKNDPLKYGFTLMEDLYREKGMRIKEHPILEFNQKEKIKFTLDGKELEGYKDEPIAAALVAAGIKVLSRSIKYHRPRGFFCAIGKCSACLMKVNGIPNIRTCVTKLEEGMKVETQKGKGDFN